MNHQFKESDFTMTSGNIWRWKLKYCNPSLMQKFRLYYGHFLSSFRMSVRVNGLSSVKYNTRDTTTAKQQRGNLGKSAISFHDIDYSAVNGKYINWSDYWTWWWCYQIVIISWHYPIWAELLLFFAHQIKRYLIASNWIWVKLSKTKSLRS